MEERSLMLAKDFQCKRKSSNRWRVAGAKHIHALAEYGATVILHTDHCAKNYLGLMDY
jgi:fructose-bisphosphate aldolase class II